jgi:ribosomal protein S18 acetylase RimI-like enzyme
MTSLETLPAVQAVSAPQAQLAIAPLVLAFATDPAVRWMYPDAHQYRTFFPQFVRAFAGKAFALGTAQTVGHFLGTALWLPPGVLPEDEVVGPLLQETVTTDRQEDLFALLDQMGAHHPTVPHWYLPLIGVDAAHQRRGLGSVLLQSMLVLCDRQGFPAHLEATSPENVPLYERHGFEVRAEMRAGSSPSIFAMTRLPR